jgi:hypothetical protein
MLKVIFQFWNYQRRDNSLRFDLPSGASQTCGGGYYDCYLLYDGSVLVSLNRQIWGTSNTHFWPFYLDPDGKVTGKANDTLIIGIYYNGRVATGKYLLPNSRWYNQTWQPSNDPDWFRWG